MTPHKNNMRINPERLWQSLADMAEIGPGLRGGNNRQTLTDADQEGRALFTSWAEAAGCRVSVDRVGNMFARRPGTEVDADPIAIGSHLDTQPTGGRYDGVLGVLAGLEILRTLNDLGVSTRRPIEIVNWTNEEGARFAPAMLGSGVFAGVHSEDWANTQTDSDGFEFGTELERIGFRGEETPGDRTFHAYLELHIEQGPVLEAKGVDIGVVTHGQGLRWIEATLEGREAHTGTTPLAMRRDAGLGAARAVELVNSIAMKYAPLAVGTVGQLEILPNSRNVVSGKTVFTADFRHPDKDTLFLMEAEYRNGLSEIAKALNLGLSFDVVGGFDPVAFDPDLLERIRAAAKTQGYSQIDLISGAGHDACWVNSVAPTAMIFCPCVGGISHNEDEQILPEWAQAGADVLLHAAIDIAEAK